MASDPKDVVLSYLKGFETKDAAKIRSLLHSNGTFKGPLKTFDNADDFVAELRNFIPITKGVRISKVFVSGNDVSVLYDFETIIPSIPALRVSEWFTIENGIIVEQEVHYNPIPFIQAVEKGEFQEALKASESK